MPVAGKGRGRGALKTITMPGMLEKSSRGSGDGQEKRSSQLSPPPSELYEARVTEILDCSTFWAQIGTGKSDKPLETVRLHVHLYRECTCGHTRELVNSLKMKHCSQL